VGLFVTEDRYPGATPNTRRALTQADLNAYTVRKLRDAAKVAKLKIEVPGWKPAAWAHVGIPSKKVAIVIIGSNLTLKAQSLRDSWSKYGWRCLCIPRYLVDKAMVDVLAKDLLDAIEEVGK
jgi:hypothetical protein